MQQDNVQVIKERLDVVDVIKQYLKLTPAGKYFKGLCPFHKEKSPSFMVSPDRQIWHCFGCAAGGDIFSFVMKYENVEFFDALKTLAEKAGVEIRSIATPDQKKINNLYDINRSAQEFFVKNLSGSPLDYLLNRGLKQETINEFGVGFAPNGSDNLLRHLLNAGYAVEDIERAGLVTKTERGTYWDRFRNRVMFPINNHLGKTVGFTGRIMPGEIAEVGKYVNSPETPIYHKSKILFGFDKSKNAIRDAKAAILVEGQMDFLMMWQDGVKNLAAISGTALTGDHLATLRRLADSLHLIFDNDEAGQAATERAIDLAQASDFSVKVVRLDSGKDPADFVQEKPGEISAVITGALSAMEFYFHRHLSDDSDSVRQKRGLRVVLGKIKTMFSPVERSHWIRRLSIKTGIRESDLSEELNKLPEQNMVSAPAEPLTDSLNDKQKIPRRVLISRQLVSLAAQKNWLERLQPHLEYFPVQYKDLIASGLKSVDPKIEMVFSLSSIPLEEEKFEPYFTTLILELKKEYWKEKRTAASQAVRQAEFAGDKDAVAKTEAEFDTITKEMHNL
ncbi:MAG: DNA primase [Patescibacteria group bacterium]